ncbi:uncharacterized protein LOC135309353 [Passer domesticus]|uniref:uncharacterized protein LOC135309353 n=1 Tax=Passer domesticus TaxID=48849 RepID=UPI0030FE2034
MVPSNPDSGMAGTFLILFKVFRGKKNKGPGAAPGKRLEEPKHFQPLQDDAAVEHTQEQQSSRGRFRRTAQMFQKFPCIRRRETNTTAVERPAEPYLGLTQLQAEPDVSPDSAGLSQDMDTSGTETWAQDLPTSVTEDAVITNTDNEETEALKNTGAMPTPLVVCASTVHFFLESAVPYQQQVPAMVKNIHQSLMSHVTVDARLQSDIVRLAEEHPADVALTLLHCAPTCDRFAVQAMKALLCRLECDQEVMAMERKCGWDMLLCAHTQHYAVGLLAREMRCVSLSLCSGIALHLLGLLSREEPHWDLPGLAFLVEVLECLDYSECADSVVEVSSRYLQSECRERRRLALRGLVVLSKDPSMARRMGTLSPSLLELLGDADGELVGMTLSVSTNLLKSKDMLVSSTTAPKLVEALLLLFDHDNSHVQLLSLDLFFKVMDLVVEEGKKPLKSVVCQSLPALFFHCHDKNQRVAEASWETLHCAAGFLQRRDLKELVETEKLLAFAEVLVRTAWNPQPQPGEGP